MTLFEFTKPRLAATPYPKIVAAYFEQYYPSLYSEAKAIADDTIARAEALQVPDAAMMPDDVSAGLQLVGALLEVHVTDG